MIDPHSLFLLIAALVSVIGLILLIAVAKLNPFITLVVVLGTMLGKMMAESGGADQIAYTLIRLFGEKHVHWAMVVIGLIVGLPAFFEVGFVLLIPIAYTVARR